jgi:hypothetical protein
MMRVRPRVVAGVAVVTAVGIQLVRPARTNPVAPASMALGAHVPVPPEVDDVLRRACRDCHTNETAWPWYTDVAPVSWLVINHVNDGRRHFNYAEWERYDQKKQQRLLTKSCELSRSGDMPVPSYLWIHRNAHLSGTDVDAICHWVETIQKR